MPESKYELVAIKPMTYLNRQLVAGNNFQAGPIDMLVLLKDRKAVLRDKFKGQIVNQTAKRKAEPAKPPVVEQPKPVEPKQAEPEREKPQDGRYIPARTHREIADKSED